MVSQIRAKGRGGSIVTLGQERRNLGAVLTGRAARSFQSATTRAWLRCGVDAPQRTKKSHRVTFRSRRWSPGGGKPCQNPVVRFQPLSSDLQSTSWGCDKVRWSTNPADNQMTGPLASKLSFQMVLILGLFEADFLSCSYHTSAAQDSCILADSDSLWCERAADNTIGPVVASCARAFDSTLLFEQLILCLPVQILFLLLVPWRTFNLHKSRPKIRRSWMSFGKPVAALPLIAAQVFLLVLYCNDNIIRTKASIPVTALSLVTSLLLGPFSCIEHHRSVRPSTLLNCWLVLSIILDIPQTRTLYLIPGALQLAVVFSTALGAKFRYVGIPPLKRENRTGFGGWWAAHAPASPYFARQLNRAGTTVAISHQNRIVWFNLSLVLAKRYFQKDS